MGDACSGCGGCVSWPGRRGVGVGAGDTDKTIRIENAQPAMMKLNDAFLAQRAQNAVHMDERKSRRITDMRLGERKLHLLDAVAWPLSPAAHDHFQTQAGNAPARIAPAAAGEGVEGGTHGRGRGGERGWPQG